MDNPDAQSFHQHLETAGPHGDVAGFLAVLRGRVERIENGLAAAEKRIAELEDVDTEPSPRSDTAKHIAAIALCASLAALVLASVAALAPCTP